MHGYWNRTIESLDIVAVCGNKVECCFDIVAGVDGALIVAVVINHWPSVATEMPAQLIFQSYVRRIWEWLCIIRDGSFDGADASVQPWRCQILLSTSVLPHPHDEHFLTKSYRNAGFCISNFKKIPGLPRTGWATRYRILLRLRPCFLNLDPSSQLCTLRRHCLAAANVQFLVGAYRLGGSFWINFNRKNGNYTSRRGIIR